MHADTTPNRTAATRERSIRTVSLLLVGSQGLIGVWAYLSPHGFYTGFPVPGSNWLTALGSFDGHIVRDLGIAWIALAIVGTWAARRGSMAALRSVLGAFLAAGALHLAYHVTTFDHFDAAAAALQSGSLLALIVVPAALLVVVSRPHPHQGGSR